MSQSTVHASSPSSDGSAAGMVFPRQNTAAGADPYDAFTWVRHDVKMLNWKDGSVTFEQDGVEFPAHWSENAVKIVASKYFRGATGSADREWSLRQVVDRVVGKYQQAAVDFGYMDEQNADVFAAELKFALVDQQFSFNSPVWFNVGTSSPQQVSACFILSVSDSMDSILDWYKQEGLIFKGGSGAGVSLSAIRGSNELLRSGGSASGPVSFMRGADASAGTIKSGGATRRAAKMVILDVDHPDIAEFVTVKAREEDKIRALRDAGFDMSLGGADMTSVQYQNANNSVRVNDEFMRAVEQGREFQLMPRTSSAEPTPVDARELFRLMAQAAWECADPGVQYDGAIQQWHTLPNSGRITASNPCSEYMSLDNSSCNLASIRLTKFFNPETGIFDVPGFMYLSRLLMTAAEVSIAFGHFPTQEITEMTRKIRAIGLGFTDLGAMLMAAGAGYDSELGRQWAGAVTSLLAATAYSTSSELARVVGTFELFEPNRDAMLSVMQMHQQHAVRLVGEVTHAGWDKAQPESGNLLEVAAAGSGVWQDVVLDGQVSGFRNAQAVVIAPTGTISFMMDADTTGIEPGLGLVMSKRIADGSSIMIVNQMVPTALRRLGYGPEDVERICAFVVEQGTIVGAPGFDAQAHGAVFATAMGDNVVSADGHLKMMAAVQPFVSGAISKTINMPADASVEDIEDVYMKAWKYGLKAVAVYRDQCKVGQPLSVAGAAAASQEGVPGGEGPGSDVPAVRRERLPRSRSARTVSFTVAGVEGYITTGEYEDGRLGELFMKVSKQGSTLAGIMDALAMSVSVGLQYGVPLEVFVAKYVNSKFEPAGMTDDPDLRIAGSLLDYTFRRLALDYLPFDVREGMGILSSAERAAALDGSDPTAVVDAAAVPQSPQASARAGVGSGATDDAHVAAVTATLQMEGPLCLTCGIPTVRAGSCHTCPSCGSSTGCG